jgi:hypothetical protein
MCNLTTVQAECTKDEACNPLLHKFDCSDESFQSAYYNDLCAHQVLHVPSCLLCACGVSTLGGRERHVSKEQRDFFVAAAVCRALNRVSGSRTFG